MSKRTKEVPSPFRNRIAGHGMKPAINFLAHPDNWRIHSQIQQAAMKGILSEIGWLQQVVENVATGRVLDGHMRIMLALGEGEQTPVPYTQVDISPREERLALALFDPIGAMAGRDEVKFRAIAIDLPVTQIDLDAVLRLGRETTRGLTRDVKVNACTCCAGQCDPGCGCWQKGKR